MITERRWRNLEDKFEDGKEDKHWEEREEEGEKVKREWAGKKRQK